MTLKLKATAARAVFEFEEAGMTASWSLSTKDSGPELVGKLERMLAFLRREKLGEQLAPVLQLPLPESPLPTPAGWAVRPPQFTGVPPVQPVPLQDSLAAMPSGWELYDEANSDD